MTDQNLTFPKQQVLFQVQAFISKYTNYKPINHFKQIFNIFKKYLSLMKVVILLGVKGEYVTRKLKCITAWKLVWEVSFSGSKWIF